MNAAHITGGPGKITHLGITPASGDISISLDAQPQAIATVQHGAQAAFFQGLGVYTLTFTPVAALASLADWFNFIGALNLGAAITPKMLEVSAINTTTEVLTVSSTSTLTTADAVHVAWGDGTPPSLSSGSLSPTTVYYVRVIDSTTCTLHASASDATNNTSPIGFSAWTEDCPFYITRDLPTVVHFADGRKLTFHNTAIVALPVITGSASNLHFEGNVVIQAFCKTGAEPDDANSTFTSARAAYSAPSTVAATRLTSPMTCTWGSGVFASMMSETPWKITIAPQLADITNNVQGLASKRLTGVNITVTGKPQNLKVSDIETALDLQGTNGGAGSIMTPTQMVLTGTAGASTFSFTIDKMILPQAQLMASLTQQRVGELTWQSSGLSSAAFFTIATS